MFVAAAAFLFAFLFSRLQPLLFQSSVVSRQQSVVRSQPSATLLPCLRFCFCSCLSCCHSRRESAVPVVSRQQSVVSHAATVVVAFLAVIPAGNLLLPFPSSSANPTRDQRKRHPRRVARKARVCCMQCLSCCHSRRESAVAFPVVLSNPTRAQRKRRRANAPPLHAMLIPKGKLLSQ